MEKGRKSARDRYARFTKARKQAQDLVQRAWERGDILNLNRNDHGVLCVDCGSKATCWEHRDYEKPLEVDPVCASCNKKRGPGKNDYVTST